jgi:paraquat-inducible protein A
VRGIEKKLGSCEICHQIVTFPPKEKEDATAICPRCGHCVHLRIPHSIQETWAFIVASIIFYIPANYFPMMHVYSISGVQSDTIWSGIVYFYETGSYFIAAVILIASIIVPFIKIFILSYLLITVQRKKIKNKKEKAQLYTLTEIIGKWSMVDVYVVSIMIALVQFEGLTSIKAGEGAFYFLLVVVTTMLAAMRFDVRLIWDIKENDG